MPSVGGISCDIVSGVAPPLTERVEVWVTPGMDGVGLQKLGKSDGDYQFLAVRIASAATVDAWYADIAALKGDVITVIDDWGTNYASIAIVRLPQLFKKRVLPQGCMGELHFEAKKVN